MDLAQTRLAGPRVTSGPLQVVPQDRDAVASASRGGLGLQCLLFVGSGATAGSAWGGGGGLVLKSKPGRFSGRWAESEEGEALVVSQAASTGVTGRPLVGSPVTRANCMWPAVGGAYPAGRTRPCTGNLHRKISKDRAGKAWTLSPQRTLAERKRVSRLPCPSSQPATDFLTSLPHSSVCLSPWDGQGGQEGLK